MLGRHSSHDLDTGRAKIDVVPSQPSRRLVLTGALAGVLTLGGCGVRLEDEAPDIPFVPEREPIPGEAALLAVLAHLQTRWTRVGRERGEILRQALVEAEVPQEVLEQATAPETEADTVLAFEAAVRDCGRGLLPLVGQLAAGARRTMPALWSPTGTGRWEAGKVAADALEGTRAAVYAMELIAAQRGERVRKHAGSTRQALSDLIVRQSTAAGEHAGTAALGYAVDTRITDASSARQLAQDTLIRLTGAYSDLLARLGGDRDAALETVAWMAEGQALAGGWGASTPTLIGAAEA